jgi:hypothetical protein
MQLIRLFLASMQQVVYKFISDGIVGGFEDSIGAELKHLLHLVLC